MVSNGACAGSSRDAKRRAVKLLVPKSTTHPALILIRVIKQLLSVGDRPARDPKMKENSHVVDHLGRTRHSRGTPRRAPRQVQPNFDRCRKKRLSQVVRRSSQAHPAGKTGPPWCPHPRTQHLVQFENPMCNRTWDDGEVQGRGTEMMVATAGMFPACRNGTGRATSIF